MYFSSQASTTCRLSSANFSLLFACMALSGVMGFADRSWAQGIASPVLGWAEDADQDGLADIDEVLMGMDPLDPYDGLNDVDEDGLHLAWELALGTDPAMADRWRNFNQGEGHPSHS